MDALNQQFDIIFVLAVAFIFLLTGYAMGRCSAGHPLGRVEQKEPKFDPGPAAEMDVWQESMEPIEDPGMRKPTL